MKIFIKAFLFILIIILTLITKGTLERVLYIISGILIYLITINQIKSKFRDYKKVIAGLVIGFLIGNFILINNQYKIPDKKLRAINVNQNKTAIILLFDTDMPRYDPKILIKNFIGGNPSYNIYKLPFHLYKNKILLEKLGSNINIHYNELMIKKLKKNLQDDYMVYSSYINQSPYIEESIQKAIKEGNGQIIIAPISLVETKNLETHNNIIQGARFEFNNIKFKSVNYLWDSELVIESYLEKINSNVKVDKSRVGVILVGEIFDNKIPTETYLKQDILFRQKLGSLLKSQGYDNNKVRLSFLNKSLIKAEMEILMEYGVGQIIIVHTSNESQKNHSLHMVQSLIKSLHAPEGINFTQIHGWIPDEYLIEELLKRIELAKYKDNK